MAKIFLLPIALLLSGCVLFDMPPAPPLFVKNVISLSNNWMDTGVDIKPGDIVEVHTEGELFTYENADNPSEVYQMINPVGGNHGLKLEYTADNTGFHPWRFPCMSLDNTQKGIYTGTLEIDSVFYGRLYIRISRFEPTYEEFPRPFPNAQNPRGLYTIYIDSIK